MANETVQNFRIELKITGLVTGSDGARKVVNLYKEVNFTDGTSTNQIGQIWEDEVRSLNATNEDIDLSGTTPDFKGAALDMTGMRLLYVEDLDTDTGDYIDVGPASSNGITGFCAAAGDKVRVHPGGFFLWVAPGADQATVTASTGDLLNVTAADNSTYRILVGGKNA